MVKMWRYTAVLVVLLGYLAIGLAHSITPIIREGSTDINTKPFVRVGNGYYYFENDRLVNWFEAFQSCRQLNATLISFDHIQKWKDINEFLRQFRMEQYYWTSGNDLGSVGRHVWFGTGNDITIPIWASNQPDNKNNNEHCDNLNYRAANSKDPLGLNDAPCTIQMRFICEAPMPYTASFIIWK